jgi:glycosyltransferase involved in cell wall biosynthesis
MSQSRIVYIDAPFLTRIGGDMNRSQFIWRTLQESFDADLLVIRRKDDSDDDIEAHKEGKHRSLVLESIKGQNAFLPSSIDHFSEGTMRQFRDLLAEREYDYVFLRSVVPALLAFECERVSPQTKVIVDSDLVFSQFTRGYWEKDRSIKNRFFLFESLKFRWFERKLYRHPYLFLLANPEDRKFLERAYWRGTAPSRFSLLPNAIAFKDMEESVPEEKNILFFGALDSFPNIDAFTFIMDQVYSLIKATLETSGVKLFVAGRRETPIYKELIAKHGAEKHVRILGGVDDMLATVKASLFTLFPVHQTSGTRVRVLEAAKAKRTGVTTTLGAEGYDLGDDCLLIRDSAEDYAKGVIELIEDEKKCISMGESLYEAAKGDYGEDVVAANLASDITTFQPGRIRLAIVANRFVPEVGGAETNIFFQARDLAKNGCSVTVFTPKRIVSKNLEYMEGIRVKRLWDLFNPFRQYPSNLARTYCPFLPFHLLRDQYDVVQSFPAPHYNALAALGAQKLLGKKSVLVSFDFRDYATLIKESVKITDMLDGYQPILRERLALEHNDHVFAISNKEIDFIKGYTDRVSYSPVPILVDEYKEPVESPKAKYDIDDETFIFLCLGRVSNVKGQDIALKAFDEALPQLDNAKLVIVGRRDFEPGFNGEMSDYVKDNGLGDSVIFTDVVEREEVLGWLRHSDIHVVPVRFMNSGAVVVESWASNTPVIQSDVVDPNLVVDGENGFLFKSLSVEDLAETMVRAQERRQDFAKLAEAGNELVQQRYSYEYLTSLYLAKYREVIGEGNG